MDRHTLHKLFGIGIATILVSLFLGLSLSLVIVGQWFLVVVLWAAVLLWLLFVGYLYTDGY